MLPQTLKQSSYLSLRRRRIRSLKHYSEPLSASKCLGVLMSWLRGKSRSNEESEEALADAQRNLSEVQKRGTEVSNVSNALKDFREKNHIAEQLEDIIMRRKGSLQ